jgi:hypothetical protein
MARVWIGPARLDTQWRRSAAASGENLQLLDIIEVKFVKHCPDRRCRAENWLYGLIEEVRDVEENCVAISIDRFVVNMDEPFELELAQFVHNRSASL